MILAWRRVKITPEEQRELARAQEIAEKQAAEAKSLLGAARTVGEALRRSQQRNNYGAALDNIFGDKRRREE